MDVDPAEGFYDTALNEADGAWATKDCTKAMARCQRAKVCPEGLSVKTMLSDSELLVDVVIKKRSQGFHASTIVSDLFVDHLVVLFGSHHKRATLGNPESTPVVGWSRVNVRADNSKPVVRK